MRVRNTILKACLIFALASGCSEDLLDKINKNDLSAEIYYLNEKELVTGVNGVYAAWQGLDLYAREYFFLHDMRGDDMQPGGENLELQRRQVIEGTLDASNPVMFSVWQGLYRVIHRANVVIQSADRPEVNAPDEVKNRISGEAKFHRGWAYFELVSMWGGVPLYTTYATSPSEAEGRASADEVYAQVIADLTDAVNALPETYADSDIGRATTYAARAMLARVYMQRGEYGLAKEQLDPIVNSEAFSLTDEYIDNFQEEQEFNEESLFEIAFSSNFGGLGWNPAGDGANMEVTVRGQEYGPNAWRNLIPSNELLAEFEDDDPRFEDTFYQIGDTYNNGTMTITEMQNASPKISWRKYTMIYKVPSEDQRSGINFRVIRYAEVLLMLAECENELDNGDEAIDLLNEIRDRASVMMPHYPTDEYPCLSQAQIFEAIVHEKRIELSGEQIRNRDILRWREQNKLPSEPISYFDTKHLLLPIPLQEIDNNSMISQEDQNPGY
ncbi:MAG TPA: RagB/SusD family nutrient uptake outer membrane protein [Ohtaekwangia sp.]|nr:RagB/SusD family nutrient uptake outer membrane protein [Ohtaekwangia sp.]